MSFKDHLANWFFLEHLLENTTIFVACSRYLELGIFDDAALALEEIAPEDKTRSEVLGARVAIYLAAEKWDMAVAVANHLVKIEPENSGWWINLAYATRRCEGIESAEGREDQSRPLLPPTSLNPPLMRSTMHTSTEGRDSSAMSSAIAGAAITILAVPAGLRRNETVGVGNVPITQERNSRLT